MTMCVYVKQAKQLMQGDEHTHIVIEAVRPGPTLRHITVRKTRSLQT